MPESPSRGLRQAHSKYLPNLSKSTTRQVPTYLGIGYLPVIKTPTGLRHASPSGVRLCFSQNSSLLPVSHFWPRPLCTLLNRGRPCLLCHDYDSFTYTLFSVLTTAPPSSPRACASACPCLPSTKAKAQRGRRRRRHRSRSLLPLSFPKPALIPSSQYVSASFCVTAHVLSTASRIFEPHAPSYLAMIN